MFPYSFRFLCCGRKARGITLVAAATQRLDRLREWISRPTTCCHINRRKVIRYVLVVKGASGWLEMPFETANELCKSITGV
ncbi:MAG: hypothetical protein ACKESB_00885 [Candidatus Hodgkinia cicadicola]